MQIYVKLTGSKNTYITYPCYGLLIIHEVGTTGGIINASFRVANDGQLSAAVRVEDAKFSYTPRIARTGHQLVVELKGRQGKDGASYPAR